MRDIGFSDNNDIRGDHIQLRGDHIQHGAHGLHNAMRMQGVDAGCADVFPDKGDSVEANKLSAMRGVKEQNICHFEKNIWVGEIQIDLICAKGCPNVFCPLSSFKRSQHRRCSGAENARQISIRINNGEKILIFRIAFEKALKSRTLG